MVDDKTTPAVDRLARRVKRHFLWLMLACYAAAIVFPVPGLMLRRAEWSPAAWPAAHVSLPLFLLALILFCAATTADLAQIRSMLARPLVLAAALVAVWLGPALLVVLAGYLFAWFTSSPEATGLLVGLVLVASMPVANSSVGWTQNSDGNLALALALVVLSITICPFVTPAMLTSLGMSLSPLQRDYCEALVNRFSGAFFIVWVVLPTVLGMICRWLAGAERVARATTWLTLSSALALLVLNYTNSALALPEVIHSPVSLLMATAVLAAALSVVGLVLGWAIARALRVPAATRAALLFGLSMKHTGLALILADAVLADQPLAILMIVLATLLQHLLAGVVQWYLESDR